MEEMKVIERILKDDLNFNIEYAIKIIKNFRKVKKDKTNE